MTPGERVKVALNLHEMACEMARAGIRQQQPEADEDTVNRLLAERLQLAHTS